MEFDALANMRMLETVTDKETIQLVFRKALLQHDTKTHTTVMDIAEYTGAQST
jgi:hypothetical protein